MQDEATFEKFAEISQSLESEGAKMILAERHRQINEEGWTAEHDAQHNKSDLGWAAECYLVMAMSPPAKREVMLEASNLWPAWPWAKEWWKPGKDDSNASRIRELTKAGALIAAEIDRLRGLG